MANSPEDGYSRKNKSLCLLCSNFLSLYNRDGVELISIDDAARKLGVERRRIYDIVNVLESVGMLMKKAKNQYSWKGYKAIPTALALLKEKGLEENFASSFGRSQVKVFDLEDDANGLDLTGGSKSENRKEKSLGLLTRNFVKLFICSNIEQISLDEAAKLFHGDVHNAGTMQTQKRRLYDIANVLSAVQLIEKTIQTENRKPAWRWLGTRERTDITTASALPFSTGTKKRIFGTDISNIDFKRTKVESLVKEATKQLKSEYVHNKAVTPGSEQNPKSSSGSYRYGPFTPGIVSKSIKRAHDLETLATTYRPQYHNEAVRDLFEHYVEAWKSWYSELAGRTSVEPVS
ncbi:hypothetical protein vseg_017102 [Gypsophila vaccaria]